MFSSVQFISRDLVWNYLPFEITETMKKSRNCVERLHLYSGRVFDLIKSSSKLHSITFIFLFLYLDSQSYVFEQIVIFFCIVFFPITETNKMNVNSLISNVTIIMVRLLTKTLENDICTLIIELHCTRANSLADHQFVFYRIELSFS